MIPILYANTETNFTSNGLGRLADCISCRVTEERNGIYECEFQYPVTGAMYGQIVEGRIVGVTHDDNHDVQPFDIYRRSAPINGIVTFNAHHISYRLGNVILSPYTATSCAQALAAMETNSYNANPFTFWTDKSVNANFAVTVPTQCKSILGGVHGSILDVYGTGEYEWDKFTAKLHLHRGADHGVSIRYGVNMTAITQERDVSGKYNAIAPFWKSQEGDAVVYLPEGYIVASGQSNAVPVAIDFTQDFEEQPTVAELRAKAQSRLTNDTWSPDENIKVSFVNLTDTEDYKHVAALQRVKLCDRVSVYDADLGVNAVSTQVIRVVYNTLLDRYDEIELGTAQTSLADTITSGIGEAVSGAIGEAVAGLPTVGYLDAAIQHAIDLISGGTGGYVVISRGTDGQPNEILIMDTPSAETAVNVIRINNAGIAFSQSGYSGPFTTAWTIDGAFVADFITAGRLDANLIRAGVLTGNVGSSSWNLDTGELNIAITTAGGQEVYLSTLMWVDADGLHVGTGTDSSTTALVAHDGFKVIDSGGEVTAWLGSRMQTLGTLVIRQTADGGHAFTSMTQERGD